MTAPSRPRRPAAPPRVVPAGPRREARVRAERSQRRRSRARRASTVLVALLPVAALGWLVLASPVLAVRDVEVTGISRLTEPQVVAAAGVPEGTPLARIDVGEVARAVRAALPPAGDVRVRRVWPGALELRVTERVPVAAVQRPGGVLLVDADGVGFATEKAVPQGVPVLQVDRPVPGDPVTQAVLAVLREVPAELRLARLTASTPADVRLVLTDGRTVVWGAPGGAETKSAALRVLLAKPGKVFDVSAPGLVVRR